MFRNFFPFENRAVHARLWKKCCRVGEATDGNMTRRMRFSCCIPNVTEAHSEYVILTAFPLQQWLREYDSVLRYTYVVCLVNVKPTGT